ncbi:MAG: 2-C-methyl-D-erythritol 2,4-cyclodiphosphate synthase [Bacteroidota bacterium]
MKVGFGFDVHQLKKGQQLWIGGIKIPHTKGAVGHSDADVLIHAICDALLGAANLRDIGIHFPNTSKEYKDIDSKILLKNVIELIAREGYEIGNIDATVCLEKPKISTYIPEMKMVLADTMDIDINDLSIKATTNEKMGFVGREEGVAAYAVVLIQKH